MPRSRELLLRSMCVASLLLTSLTSCGDRVEISADISCELFRHIGANDAQIQVYKDNWTVMESYADQVIANNIAYDEHCIKSEEKGAASP